MTWPEAEQGQPPRLQSCYSDSPPAGSQHVSRPPQQGLLPSKPPQPCPSPPGAEVWVSIPLRSCRSLCWPPFVMAGCPSQSAWPRVLRPRPPHDYCKDRAAAIIKPTQSRQHCAQQSQPVLLVGFEPGSLLSTPPRIHASMFKILMLKPHLAAATAQKHAKNSA
jgi:hypothetical protein